MLINIYNISEKILVFVIFLDYDSPSSFLYFAVPETALDAMQFLLDTTLDLIYPLTLFTYLNL